MRNKGFTLIELLAVISILSILGIITLPNIVRLFNEAKKNSFSTEVKEVAKVSQQKWITDSMFSTSRKIYTKCVSCNGEELDLSGRDNLEYYVVVSNLGNIDELYVTDGTYQYFYVKNNNSNNFNIEDIKNVDAISNLKEFKIFRITNTGPVFPEKPHTCISFAEDSWSTIQENVIDGYTSCYHVGDTREIDVSTLGKFVIRISNMSTPEICSTPGFSQTACGFVIEFKDNVVKRSFNTSNNVSGGWRDSDARNYLNNDFYNLLPEDLKNVITPTYAVSGHENSVVNNYETTDKLFLIATGELWQKVGTSDIAYDSADTLTRQLDYYASIPVTSTSCSGAIKKYNNSAVSWWLRSAHKTSNNYIGNVQSNGKTNAYYGHATLVYGLSPAFKIN